ncbi:MAG: YbaK/EbsC family protein [Bauldia sp.]|nr:MAG: YbaK/EbsC family protein [Bauldia sp.]MBZ0229532.1 YbaK/EbsC family protein [Bauldia sp.]
MRELPPAAHRVLAATVERGLDARIRVMPDSTRTAVEAAAAVGTTVGQIVKSLIFKGKKSGKAYLFLVSGTNRVDEHAVEKVLGEPIVRPDADFVREVTGFAIGGIPPLGHATRIASYCDEDLLQYETVWAAAGTPNAVFSVDPAALREAIGAHIIAVK